MPGATWRWPLLASVAGLARPPSRAPPLASATTKYRVHPPARPSTRAEAIRLSAVADELLEAAGVDTVPELAQRNAENLAAHLPEDHFDVVLVSNFFEHCRSREQILVVLESIHRVTKPGGRILVLGPNFKYVGDCYYDYFDHRIALTEMSMAEAVELGGFRVEEMVARTLPYSFRSRLPSWSWLIRLYFQLPVFWPLFGKQFFVVGRK